MSHFTVLVPADDDDDLAKILEPYNEQPEDDSPYLKFEVEFKKADIPVEAERLRVKYPNEYAGLTDHQVLASYGGGLKNKRGDWGHLQNPNAKWDWWQAGGRWTGLLKLKPLNTTDYNLLLADDLVGNGKPGLMTKANADPSTCDYAPAGYIDWDSMLADQLTAAAAEYDGYHALKQKLDKGEIDEKEFGRGLWDIGIFLRQDDDLGVLSREAYIEKHGQAKALTFAFIDLDGQWNERGHMGWWATVTDQNADYDQAWWQFVRSLPDEQRIYVVDCHI